MRNLKKLMAVGLAVAITVSAMVPAFAADKKAVADGIEDAKVKAAVEKLAAFGIISGKEDGKYHPEENITRDAFAKLLVEALGMGSAVVQGPTSFSDVAATDWSSGYINIAVGANLIKGRPDGTFGRTDTVTYAEAATMLVRALGYKDEFVKGTWPGNYMALAATKEINKNAKVSNTGTLNRGAVAVMLDNTLDAHPVTQKVYGDKDEFEEEKDKTLLEVKRNIQKREDRRIDSVARVNDGLKADEVKVLIKKSDSSTYETEDNSQKCIDGIDTTFLQGLKVDLYVDTTDDDKILYIDTTPSEGDVLTGYISDVKVRAGDNDIKIRQPDGNEVEVEVAKKSDLKDDAVKVNNGRDTLNVYVADDDDIDEDGDKSEYVLNQKEMKDEGGYYGRFIKNDDGKIGYFDLFKLDAKDGLIATEVSKDKSTVKGLKADNDGAKIDFSTEKGFKIFKDFKASSLDEVKADDLVYKATVREVSGDTFLYGFVVRNATVTGKLDSIKSDKATIAGKERDMGKGFTYTLDKGKKLKTWGYTDEEADKLDDALGTEVTAYLDIVGKIRHLTTAAKTTSDSLYGVVKKSATLSGDDGVKLYTKDDKEQAYAFADKIDSDIDGDGNKDTYDTWMGPNNDRAIGQVVAYELDKNGEIDESTFKVIAKNATTPVNDAKRIEVDSFNKDNDFIKATDGTKYYVTDSTVVMRYFAKNGTDIDPDVLSWKSVKSKDAPTGLNAIIAMGDGADVDFVLFTDRGSELGSDAKYALVKGDKYKTDDDWKIKLQLADGTEAEYTLDDDLSSVASKVYMQEKNFIAFSTNSNGDIDRSNVRGVVYGRDGFESNANLQALDGDLEISAGIISKYEDGLVRIQEYNEKKEFTGVERSYKVVDSTKIYVSKWDSHAAKADQAKEFDSSKLGDKSDIEVQDKDHPELGSVRALVDDGELKMLIIIEKKS